MSERKLYFVSSFRDEIDGMYNLLFENFPGQLEYKRVKLDAFQGDEDTIVKKKCMEAVKLYDGPVMVENTSLCFDAFPGLPGPYTKDFVRKVGQEGLYRMLKDWDNKGAVATCRIALCESSTSEPIIFKGVVRGIIVDPQELSYSSFDICFRPVDSSLAYSQMDPKIRDKMPYRHLAVKQLKEYLQNKKDSQM